MAGGPCCDSSAIEPTPCTLPSASTATRSATCHSRSRSCVIDDDGQAEQVAQCGGSVRRRRRRSPGRGPAVGSSRNSSSGSSASARASEARFSMPPLSSAGILARRPRARGRSARASRRRSRRSAGRRASVCSRSGRPTFSRHRQRAEQAAMLEHHAPALAQRERLVVAERCRGRRRAPGWSPESGRCSRIISRSSVDLPGAAAADHANISPRRTSRSRSCMHDMARRSACETLLISITGRRGVGVHVRGPAR